MSLKQWRWRNQESIAFELICGGESLLNSEWSDEYVFILQ